MTDTTMPRRVRMRFREYPITPDPQAVPTVTAVCVTGEDADCGATSGPRTDRDAVARWMAEHFRDTGHALFDRTTSETLVVEAGPWH
jgi:hypothetical protein